MTTETTTAPTGALLAAIAFKAGVRIMEVRARGYRVDTKADASPVTEADHAAEALIMARLAEHLPGMAVISEEAFTREGARETRAFICVDPLDGTKEFVRDDGAFTVNLGHVVDRAPVLGAVYAPALGRLFWSEGPGRAYETRIEARSNVRFDPGSGHAISVAAAPDGLRALTSRSHLDAETEAFLSRHRIAATMGLGSSLKFCLLAAGEADVYPRFGPTMEWDTAAGQAILEAAGGSVVTLDGMPLTYGKWEAGLRNPGFIAWGASPIAAPVG